MKDFNKIVQEFKSDEFKQKYRNKEMLLDNDEYLKYAVIVKAYKDMQLRTVRKTNTNAQLDTSAKEEVLKWLVGEINRCFHNKDYENKAEFDKWHNSICEKFVADFNNRVLKDNYRPISYGKAQKILNMSFKYLRCFDDANLHLSLFRNCHMPIDSLVINWYNDNNVGGDNKINCFWSNFNESCYSNIQNNIRQFCENGKENLSPLEMDFYVWKEEKEKKKRSAK